MGQFVITTSIADSKPDYLDGSQGMGALGGLVSAGELVLIVGDNVIAANNQRVVSALETLSEALRERQFPVGALANNQAYVTPPSNAATLVVENAAAEPVLTEDDVFIGYGATFYPEGNSVNFMSQLKRMTEYFQETVLKLT